MKLLILAAAVLASIALAYLWLKLWDDHVRQYPAFVEPYDAPDFV